MRALDVDQSGCYERNELVDRLCASGKVDVVSSEYICFGGV